MPTPTIAVFDLGKVLVDFDYSIAARKIATQSGMSLKMMQDYIDHSPLLVRYETGLMTREEFFEEVKRFSKFGGSLGEFAGHFGGIFTPIQEMIDLHAALRQRGIPTYIFSNTNDMAIEDIRQKFPFFQNFDGYILSYEVNSMKPDSKIYEALEKMAGRKGPDILYIDDRAENIAAGAQRGWQAVLHETPEKTHAAVRKLGLLSRS